MARGKAACCCWKGRVEDTPSGEYLKLRYKMLIGPQFYALHSAFQIVTMSSFLEQGELACR